MDHRELVDVLVKRGWSIFPCNQEKKPLTKQGFKNATTSKPVIAAWCKEYPNFKIGVPCASNYFFAVDIDPNGVPTWDAWVREFGTAGAGPRQHTPRGGMHILFKLPIGLPIPNNASKLAEGIDLRSRGYICTGQGYLWDEDPHGVTAALQDAPHWLLDKIKAYVESKNRPGLVYPGPVAGQSEDPIVAGDYFLNKALSIARPGNRNQTGFDLACQLHDNRLTRSQAEVYMRKYVQGVPKGDDPYMIGEALTSLAEAFTSSPREPAHLRLRRQGAQDFPVSRSSLPGKGSQTIPNSGEYEFLPIATFLRSDQIKELTLIAERQNVPLHLLINSIICSFLRNIHDNKNS